MKLKKLFIYVIVFLLLFQTSIERLTSFPLITYLDEIVILSCFTIAVINIFKSRRIKTADFWFLILIFCFFCVGFISRSLNSEFIFSQTVLSGFLAIKFFLIVFSFKNINLKEDTKKYFISSIILYSKLVVAFAILNIVFPKIYSVICPFAIITYRFGLISVTSLFYHTGRYGWFMLFCGIVYYSLYNSTKNKKYKNWMIICVLFSLLSYRTKVIVGVLAIIVIEMFVSKKINIKSAILLITLLIFGYLLFDNILLSTYDLYFTNKYDISARQALSNTSYEIAKDYFPIGVGFGKYASWYSEVYYSEIYYKYGLNTIYGLQPNSGVLWITDVFWPAIVGETGLIGLIIYLLLLFRIWRMIIVNRREKQYLELENVYSVIASLAFIQSLCESFGEQSFNSAPENIFLGIIIGVSLNCINKRRNTIRNIK